MSRPSCPRCRRPLSHCLCALIPRLDSRTRVLILQHPDESGHALNTAGLAALGLVNAELLVGETFGDALAERLADSSCHSVLLFPGEQAVQPAPRGKTEQPLQLVVPDGTWRKARKLLYLNPALENLPRLCLPAGLTSRYRLRKAPYPGALSTLEAIVETLGRLEPGQDFTPLLRPFEALIDGQIRAMGEQTYRRNHAGRE